MAENHPQGSLSWRLSSHPITLLCFLGFRISNHSASSVLIFIITILLLAADFYYLKNIAGRRLVGLRWWNEVDPQSGDSHWVFESSDPSVKIINATDSRFFWIALYSQPLLWVGLAFVAIFSFEFIWLTLVGMLADSLSPPLFHLLSFSRARDDGGDLWCANAAGTAIALSLTVTNTLAFSRCDRFGQASNIAGSAMSTGGIAGNLASGMIGRFFSRG
ncbi:hypothetical protein QTJ16_002724 [Diplocarpon rosae]|uniref:Golgi apparatus membrane protein TVP23 n=1 Tax=Diplocarpon rosae TaxID=946125 RepID=A0AAD9T3B7_9HELO|nr:hypothetical protein QTJ16_002724 [Diplocarpon rosae]